MSTLVVEVAMRDESANTNIEIQAHKEMLNFISEMRAVQH